MIIYALVGAGGVPSIEWRKNLLMSVHKKLTGDDMLPKQALSSINYTRNNLKHMNPGDPDNDKINIGDIVNESAKMIKRTIENYSELGKQGFDLDSDLCRKIGKFRQSAKPS